MNQKQAVAIAEALNPSATVEVADHPDHGKAVKITDSTIVRWCDIATGFQFQEETP